MAELLEVRAEEFAGELPSVREHYAQFGNRLPSELRDELDRLAEGLGAQLGRSLTSKRFPRSARAGRHGAWEGVFGCDGFLAGAAP